MSHEIPQVRPLTEEEYPVWDAFVDESPQGSIFSKSRYLEIISQASRSRLKIIGYFVHDDLMGGCSVLEKSRGLLGTHVISGGPGTPFCGLLYHDVGNAHIRKTEMDYNRCVNAICDYIKSQRYTSVSISNSPDLLDIRPFLQRGWKERVSYTYYIYLDSFSLANFSSSVKKSIKMAQSKNLSYEKSDDIHSYFHLLTTVFQQHGAHPPFDEVCYEKLLHFFQSTHSGDMRVLKDSSDQLLASYVWIWDTKRAYAWSGGAIPSPDFRDGGANKLMFYTFLEELKEMGFTEVNIMHANTPRLTQFASGFNPELKPYYSIETNRRLASCYQIMKKYLGK